MAETAQAAKAPRLLSKLHLSLESVESGIPLETMTSFISASGVELKTIYDVVIPARMLKHRRSRRQPLSPDESDKLARVVRIYDEAVRVFANAEKALRWLSRPNLSLNDRTPLQMLGTEWGGRLVEEMLIQIDEGMFV